MSLTSRRNVLKAGLASMAAGAIITPEGHSAMPGDIGPKAPDETWAMFLGGDQLHNFAAQEPSLRRICESMGMKFFAVHDSRYLTTELINQADVLMIQRWDGSVEGWVAGPIYVEAPTRDNFLTEEMADAIIDNVKNRGMGFLSLHCMVAPAFGRKKIQDFLGIKGIIHGPLQPVLVHSFNQNHPISKGIEEFVLALDENFGVEIVGENVIPLWETTGQWDKRHDYAGWCRELGKGRVAGLTAGHTYFAFQDSHYTKLYRRSIQWVLKREITP